MSISHSSVMLTHALDYFLLFFCSLSIVYLFLFFFFFNDPATTEIYTLSLHDALPIFPSSSFVVIPDTPLPPLFCVLKELKLWRLDRKSTRLNSSHVAISYAVFCLKKKKTS